MLLCLIFVLRNVSLFYQVEISVAVLVAASNLIVLVLSPTLMVILAFLFSMPMALMVTEF